MPLKIFKERGMSTSQALLNSDNNEEIDWNYVQLSTNNEASQATNRHEYSTRIANTIQLHSSQPYPCKSHNVNVPNITKYKSLPINLPTTKDKQDLANYDAVFKFLFIGDICVGKSCIISQFISNKYSSEHIPTIGTDFKCSSLNIGDNDIKILIWDTSGDIQFKAVTTAYYRTANVIFVVYDITNKKSFENIVSWLEKIESHSYQNKPLIDDYWK